MHDQLAIHCTITNPLFRQAVDLIDAGQVVELAEHLEQHADLLGIAAGFSETSFPSGTKPGQYFEQPKLLWFIAENPIRNGTLPDNIADVAQCIINMQRVHSRDTLQRDLDYTLGLVVSGRVVRETGNQRDLIAALVGSGANPNCAENALSHGERDAVQTLLDHGAEMTVVIAAGMGLIDDLRLLLVGADETSQLKALSCAAINGQSAICSILVDHGVDPNQFNPEGFHTHCTPLHNAVSGGSYETVGNLVGAGADTTIRDTMFDADALGWARYLKLARGCPKNLNFEK